MDSFGMGRSSSTSKKDMLMDEVRQQNAMNQARLLIEKVTLNCFEKCVPKPGTSLSSGEEQCLTKCMEKYINSWNLVSRQYVEKAKTAGGTI